MMADLVKRHTGFIGTVRCMLSPWRAGLTNPHTVRWKWSPQEMFSSWYQNGSVHWPMHRENSTQAVESRIWEAVTWWGGVGSSFKVSDREGESCGCYQDLRGFGTSCSVSARYVLGVFEATEGEGKTMIEKLWISNAYWSYGLRSGHCIVSTSLSRHYLNVLSTNKKE